MEHLVNLQYLVVSVEIEHNKVSIVTPDCQDPSSIDVDRARRAKERAEGRLSNPTPDIDVERAEAALQRALCACM